MNDGDAERWRGGVDARLGALERIVGEMSGTVNHFDKAVVRIDGSLKALKDDVTDCRDEVRQAAGQIAKEKDDALKKVEATLAAKLAEGHAWRLSKFQVFVGSGVVALTAILVALIQLAITGQFS